MAETAAADGGLPNAPPSWAFRPVRQCLQSLNDEDTFLHMAIRGLGQLSAVPQVLEYLAKYDDEAEKRGTHASIPLAKRDAEWVASQRDCGFALLHAHSVVGLWGSLEVLCEDLVVAWLCNLPTAWEVDAVSRLSVSLGEFRKLSDDDAARFTTRLLRQALKTDLKLGVGKLTPLLDLFKLSPAIGQTLRNALHELSQVRHVIVHRGSRADSDLIRHCPWLQLRVGDPVLIPHAIYGWYRMAATRFCERVANQIMIAFGLEGCRCPGMDDIGPRPQAQVGETSLRQAAPNAPPPAGTSDYLCGPA